MDSAVAMAIGIVVLAAVLWAVFGDDPCASIYDDELDDHDPRAQRDPWGDVR